MNRRSQDEGTEATRIAAAAAAVRAWEEACTKLTPIIGERGFQLLYKRSLHLTAATFPWLAPQEIAQQDPSFADLRLRLEREAPARAEEASQALFATLTGLLNTLIGETLTTRLLAPMPRRDGADAGPQEIQQ